MKMLGIVGSGSTTTRAPVIVWDAVEMFAKEEQFVLIDDVGRGFKYLGVLRNARRYEPFLSAYRRTSYVDDPSLTDVGTLPYTAVYASIIGVIEGGRVRKPQLPPNPGSKVYVVESSKDLTLDLGEGLVIGKHSYSGIEVPLNPKWLPYHVAIVGATGSGKSCLVRALIDEILRKTDYRVIVFDHTGMDYVINASRISLDAATVADMILDRTGLYRNTYDPYISLAVLYYAWSKSSSKEENREAEEAGGEEQAPVKPVARRKSWLRQPRYSYGAIADNSVLEVNRLLENLDKIDLSSVTDVEWSRAEFKKALDSVIEYLASRGKESVKIRSFTAVDLKLGDSFFNSLSNRNVRPYEVIEKCRESKLAVVDLSTEDIAVRRHVIATVLDELWKAVEKEKKPINTIVIIDEAHNYACRFCGASRNAVARVAREGRKWGLGLVLVSQRAMDLDPEVRGNINTWIFSKLQTPTDFNELSGYMNLAGISEDALALLERREFYVAGLMNPLKIPVLIKVRDVGG